MPPTKCLGTDCSFAGPAETHWFFSLPFLRSSFCPSFLLFIVCSLLVGFCSPFNARFPATSDCYVLLVFRFLPPSPCRSSSLRHLLLRSALTSYSARVFCVVFLSLGLALSFTRALPLPFRTNTY